MMHGSSSQRELIDLLSHPAIVGPDGVPPGASESDIQAFERVYGLRLPPTLCDWFSVVNGAFCGTQSFLGLNDYRVDSKHFLGRSWLPVAADGCGDYYSIDLSAPDQGDYPVFFWDHETDYDSGLPMKGYAVASNVWIFSLLFLKQELARASHDKGERWHWPFDRGRTLQHDPNLARVISAPLPWKADGTPV
jgi:hypothetical protein